MTDQTSTETTETQEFVVMTYNPSKNYLWTMHKKGCSDINKELRGYHTDSGFPAINPETIVAKDWQAAADQYIDEELTEMGWNTDSIKINPCCKKAAPKPVSKPPQVKEVVEALTTKTTMKTIDCTPTPEAYAVSLLAIITNSSDQGDKAWARSTIVNAFKVMSSLNPEAWGGEPVEFAGQLRTNKEITSEIAAMTEKCDGLGALDFGRGIYGTRKAVLSWVLKATDEKPSEH